MLQARLLICFFALAIFTGCGGRGGSGSVGSTGPGTTFTPPSTSAVLLAPPTVIQQVQQPYSPTCAPAVGVTIYRVVTGKDYNFDQAIVEMHTGVNGTYLSEFIYWLNSHELSATKTVLPRNWVVSMITEQIKSGYYVIPYVNENAVADNPHVFIVYGVDGDRILVSDSNKHNGSNIFAIDAGVFESEWLVNVGTKEAPSALLIFVKSSPRSSTKRAGSSEISKKMTYGDLLIK